MIPEFACASPSVCAGMRVRPPFGPRIRVMMVSMPVHSGGDLAVLRLRHGEGRLGEDGDDNNV